MTSKWAEMIPKWTFRSITIYFNVFLTLSWSIVLLGNVLIILIILKCIFMKYY